VEMLDHFREIRHTDQYSFNFFTSEDESELPEWVKLVNRTLHGERKWEEEKKHFDKGT